MKEACGQKHSERRTCGHTSRVLVFGVDAGDLAQLKELVRNGQLPSFERVMREGVARILRSAIPDMTPPSWTSVFTGVGPGEHGIYGFLQPVKGRIVVTSAADRKVRAIWNTMDPRCQKVLLGVPITYPVEQINGTMISDPLLSLESTRWIHPAELRDEVRALGYEKCFSVEGGKLSLRSLCDSIETKSRVFSVLLERYDWCFAAIVFREADWALHRFPASNEKTVSVFKALDSALGRVLRQVDERTTILIVSDHGRTISRRYFFANNWLLRIGLLKLRQSKSRPWAKCINSILEKGLPLGARFLPESLMQIRSRFLEPKRDLATFSGLYLLGGDVGRFQRLYLTDDCIASYYSFEQQLRAELENLFDPHGKKVTLKLMSKHDLYTDNPPISAPDFVLEVDPMYVTNSLVFSSRLVFAGSGVKGAHRPEGLFIGYRLSPELVPADQTISVNDIFPMVLQQLLVLKISH